MTRYDKLVRDGVPAAIEASGDTYSVHRASDEEFLNKLREKLQEEVNEFSIQPSINELADILEVLYALAEQMGASASTLDGARVDKARRLGSFRDRIILEEASTPAPNGPD